MISIETRTEMLEMLSKSKNDYNTIEFQKNDNNVTARFYFKIPNDDPDAYSDHTIDNAGTLIYNAYTKPGLIDTITYFNDFHQFFKEYERMCNEY